MINVKKSKIVPGPRTEEDIESIVHATENSSSKFLAVNIWELLFSRMGNND